MKAGIDYTGVAVAFFCHDGEGNFLFHKRSNKCRDQHGKWDCGGGGVDFGESLEEALMRELKEEYGCTGVIEQMLIPSSMYVEENGVHKHWIAIPYVVRVNRSEVTIGEPESIDELGWFTLDEIPEPLHPGVRIDLEGNIEVLRGLVDKR